MQIPTVLRDELLVLGKNSACRGWLVTRLLGISTTTTRKTTKGYGDGLWLMGIFIGTYHSCLVSFLWSFKGND